MSSLLTAITIGLATGATHAQRPAGNAPVFPSTSWEGVSPESLSVACKQDLVNTRSYLQTLDTTALMAVDNGKVLFSYGPVETVSMVASARKSILSMLYGRYVMDGTIKLDATLADLGIDDTGGLLPIERQATVRDLLTARSGVYHAAANAGDNAAYAPARGSQVPGTYFLYNNWDFNAAGTVFEMLSKRSIYRAFADDIAAPLQLEDFNLARHHLGGDRSKSRHLAYPFYLSTRDMARIGYLMLQHGNWQGQQLVADAWVAKTTSPVTAAADMHPVHTKHHQSDFGYGYLWWTLTEPPGSLLEGAYFAWGQFGQFILIIPKREVPEKAWDATWVQEFDFLKAARMLAAAPCQ